MKLGRTTLEFINGSAFSVDCEGIIIPVIQKGNELSVDLDVLTELKRTEYREEIEGFIKTNKESILLDNNLIFISESKEIKANKIILVKFNSDESYGGDSVKSLNEKLISILSYVCTQNVVTISIPQLLKVCFT